MKRTIALTTLCLLVALLAGCINAHDQRDMKPVSPSDGTSPAADAPAKQS